MNNIFESIRNNDLCSFITGIKLQNNSNKVKILLLIIYEAIKKNIREDYLISFLKIILENNDLNIFLIKGIRKAIKLLKQNRYPYRRKLSQVIH